MSVNLPPTYFFNNINFNPEFYSSDLTSLSQSEADLLYVKYPNSQSGTENFNGPVNFINEVNFNNIATPPHCDAVPVSNNDLVNKLYVDSVSPRVSYIVYCNYSETFTTTTPTIYKKLSTTEVFTNQIVPFVSIINTPILIGGFFNTLSDLKFSNPLNAGNLTLLTFANVDSTNDQQHCGINFQLVAVSAGGFETIIATSVSSSLISVVAPLIGSYSSILTVPSTNLSAYTQIGIKIYLTGNANNHTGNIYFQYNDYYTEFITTYGIVTAPDLLTTNNVWTGSNTFNGGLAGNASGLTSVNASTITTTTTQGNPTTDIYRPIYSLSGVGASSLVPYSSDMVQVQPNTNTLSVNNLLIRGAAALSINGGSINVPNTSLANMIINTHATSPSSVLLQTQGVNRLTIDSAGNATFSGIVSGNGSGLTSVNASTISTVSTPAGLYYPLMASDGVGGASKIPYTSSTIEIDAANNAVSVGNFKIKGAGAIMTLDGGNIQMSSNSSFDMKLNTHLTSTGSVILQTQGVNRLTINSTGDAAFSGIVSGNGSGLTNTNSSTINTTTASGALTHYPVLTTNNLGVPNMIPYTNNTLSINPSSNTVNTGNLNIAGSNTTLNIQSGNIKITDGFNSNNLTLNTNAASSGSLQLQTVGVNRLTINSAGIATFSSPPIMSGNSITAGTIPINCVVGTAVNVNGTQTITGTKTFSNTIVGDISGTAAIATNATNVNLGTTVAITNYLVMTTTNTGQSALKTSTVTYDPTFNELNCSITGNSGTTSSIDIIDDSAGGISRNFIMGPVSGVSNPYASSTLNFVPNTSIMNFSGTTPKISTSSQSLILAPQNNTALTARIDGVCIFSNAPRLPVLVLTGSTVLLTPLDSLYIINIAGTTGATFSIPNVTSVDSGTQIIFKRRSGTGVHTIQTATAGNNIIAINGISPVASISLAAGQYQTTFISYDVLWYQIAVQ